MRGSSSRTASASPKPRWLADVESRSIEAAALGSRLRDSARTAIGRAALDPSDARAGPVRGIPRGLRGQPDGAHPPSVRSEARVSDRSGRGEVNRKTLRIFGCPADPIHIRLEADVDAQRA